MSDRRSHCGCRSASGEDAWFARSFDALYLELYRHRDERDAIRFARVLRAQGLQDPICEVACGSGRFLRALAAAGARVCGLDLSVPLLARARADLGGGMLARGDMRALPFRGGAFATVLLLFTSFGYFHDAGDDRLVLAEAARALRPGGGFVLDFFNLDPTLRSLVAESRRTVAGLRVVERRWIDPGGPFLRKTVEAESDQGGVPGLPREERVRLYAPAQLRDLLAAHGFAVRSEFGDYDGRPFDAAGSARFIALAHKE